MTKMEFSIAIRPSRSLGLLVVAMHAMAILATWIAVINLLAKLVLTLSLLFSAGYYFQVLLRQTGKCQRLLYRSDNGWRLVDENKAVIQVNLQQCFISLKLIIINFQQGRKRRTLLLLADSADANKLRKLRILLRQQ